MRSGFAAGLMGIGGILMSFGAVIVVIALLARRADPHAQSPAMFTVATGSLVAGAVMFGAGYLLGRLGRNSDQSARPERGTA
jgi:ABC-type transport system involved in multi-copper enzyme maturation permease subunit